MAERIYKNIRLVHERSKQYFTHFIIPHEDNHYRPKILHPNLLRFYSIVIILAKVFVTGFLFVSYPTRGEFASFTAEQIVQLTNSEREKNGLNALTMDTRLNRAAANKASDMLAKGYFDHTGPDGSRPWDWVSASGYNYIYAGENLAKDFTSASSTVAALMNSASHRKNILNENYKNIGVAVADGQINGKQTVVMVQFFGAVYEPKTETAVTPSQPVSQPTEPEPQTPSVPATQPEPEIYKAELVNQRADSIQLASGISTTIWAEFKNTGNITWKNYGPHFIALNLINPIGRQSLFRDDNWVENYRPMIMNSTEVAPGQTERFEFTVKTPEQAGTYQEDFGLVAENLAWIEGGVFGVQFIVTGAEVKPAETVKEDMTPTEQTLATIPTAITPQTETFAPQTKVERNTGLEEKIIFYSQRLFLVLLIFLVIALVINIFVKIRIQHYPTILRTLLVIILAGLLYVTRIHFVESLGNYINIF